jgi:acetamidase/formamidase
MIFDCIFLLPIDCIFLRRGIQKQSPDIPPVVTVKPGEIFKIECVDWTGGQIKNTDDADDVRDVDLTKIHNVIYCILEFARS